MINVIREIDLKTRCIVQMKQGWKLITNNFKIEKRNHI